MFKAIGRILIVCLLFLSILWIGKYTFNEFETEIELKRPHDIFGPYMSDLGLSNDSSSSNGSNSIDTDKNGYNGPDFSEDPGLTDPGSLFGNNNSDESNDNSEFDDNLNKKDLPNVFFTTKDISYLSSSDYNNLSSNELMMLLSANNGELLTLSGNNLGYAENPNDYFNSSYYYNYANRYSDALVRANNSSNTEEDPNYPDNFSLYEDTVVDCINWLLVKDQTGNTINYFINAGPNSLMNTAIEETESSNETINSEEETLETEENIIELTYDNILLDKEHLTVLVDSINIIDELPEYDNYDRNDYEQPASSYIINESKYNRNDYAWKTSKWFNEDDFTYTCPYTGTVIHDLDDNKEDQDFGNLESDHIVPLHSTYLRGADKWSKKQKNEYAYNQWVGVDVLNSANRSKSDKGPCDYLPDINVEDYCYSWLMICSKYKLSMTQEEINICVKYINNALNKNEPVEFLGGNYIENN